MFESAAFSGFSVNDIGTAREFYTNLGVPIEDQPKGMGFALKFANGHSVFIYEKPNHVPAEFTVLNFPVDDIEKAVSELTAKGVELLQYDNLPAPQDDKQILRGLGVGYGPDIAWFTDPAGNILSVLQES